jgi:hypothetical protein
MKDLKFVLILISFLLATSLLHAEGNESNKYKSLENVGTIRVLIGVSDLSFTIEHYDEDGGDIDYTKEIAYYPNRGVFYGIDLSLYDYGISVKKEEGSTKDEELYGKSDYYNFVFYKYSSKYGIDLHYQKYKGFYIDNPVDFGYQRGDPETIRSDLKAISFGINYFYVFSDDFSLSAAFHQLAVQYRWDWSFMLMISMDYTSISSDYSLIPPQEEEYYGKYAGFSDGRFISLGVSPGIGVTIPLSKFYYFTSAFFFGGGYMNKRYETDTGEFRKNRSFTKANLKLSTGYNDIDIFFGMLFLVDLTSTQPIIAAGGSGIRFDTLVAYGEFFAGTRFDLNL